MNQFTNNTRRLYASLSSAKGRRECGLFMAQGTKCVLDTINAFRLEALLATSSWLDAHPLLQSRKETIVVKKSDIERITTLSCPPDVIAVYHIPPAEVPDISGKLVLALDCVQDPGNLGTIMRVADWMGIDTILASRDTADLWNPKVVQATMGAISRVKIHYTDLCEFLAQNSKSTIYGTFLDGENIYNATLEEEGIIIMGNEGKGISEQVAANVNRRLFIPPFPYGRATSESLNVAVATAITLSEFRRRSPRQS